MKKPSNFCAAGMLPSSHTHLVLGKFEHSQVSKIFLRLSLIIILYSFSIKSFAQINNSTTLDFQASFTSLSSPVNNTGADMTQFLSSLGGESMVKCWDGATPTWSHSISNVLQKDYVINGTTLGTVSDPDIVIEPLNGDFVMIVYVLNGRIYNEIWNWSGADYILFQSPALLSGSGLCSNPNIDVNLSGEVAITWEDNGTGTINEIYALVGNINGSGFGPATFIRADARRPDIAISRRNISGSSDVVVSLTYDIIGVGLGLYQLEYNTLFSGVNTSISNNIYSINDFGWGSTSIVGSFQYPRIAATNFLGSSPFLPYYQQVAIAVDFQCTNGAIPPYTIYSLTRTLTSLSPVTFNDNRQLLNKPLNLYNQINEKPVISYTGRYITVAWQGDFNSFIGGTGALDVISRRLNTWDGNPWLINTYSIVNQNVPNNQIQASVCGRHTGAEVGFVFYDDNLTPSGNTQIVFKQSSSSATSYRIEYIDDKNQANLFENTVSEYLEVYPNPAQNFLNIKSALTEVEIRIYSLTGSLVKSEASQAIDLHTIDVSSLNPGSYILRVDGAGLSKQVPLIKLK